MSSISIAGNTSGSVTLSAPDVAGTTTLTLPSTSGTVVTTTSGSITSSQLPAGSVLQVVSVSKSTEANTNSTAFVTTGLAATITPKFSTSKILIISNGSFYGTSTYNSYYTIYRGSTNLEITANRGFAEANCAANTGGIMTLSYLDSPATTSATTYTIYTKQSAIVYFPVDGCTATITLMEIAA